VIELKNIPQGRAAAREERDGEKREATRAKNPSSDVNLEVSLDVLILSKET